MTISNEKLFTKLKAIELDIHKVLTLVREMHGIETTNQEKPVTFANAEQKQKIAITREKLGMAPMPVQWFDSLRNADAHNEIERLQSYQQDDMTKKAHDRADKIVAACVKLDCELWPPETPKTGTFIRKINSDYAQLLAKALEQDPDAVDDVLIEWCVGMRNGGKETQHDDI